MLSSSWNYLKVQEEVLDLENVKRARGQEQEIRQKGGIELLMHVQKTVNEQINNLHSKDLKIKHLQQ